MRRRLGTLALAALFLAGCFDAPEVEERWTRLDITGSSVAQNQALPPSSSQTITVGADITYRRILTGFAVAELRASSSVTNLAVTLDPEAEQRLGMARDIDRILAGSTSLGRMTRAVTGWDHLIQHIDFTFTGVTPAAGDSSARGLFLLCYLGSGEEVELPGGGDSIIVTPFASERYEILPVGMELRVGP